MKRLIGFLIFASGAATAQEIAPLTVEKIMRDPKWIGVSPSLPFWSTDSKTLYFNWNPDLNAGDSLYGITLADTKPHKISPKVRRELAPIIGIYNRNRTKKIFEKNGDIFLIDILKNKTTRITNTEEREYNAFFSGDESRIFYTVSMNLFSWEIATGIITQHTDLRKGLKKDAHLSDGEKWLKEDQLATSEVLKRRHDQKRQSELMLKSEKPKRPREIYIDEKSADNFQVSPDGNYITFKLTKSTPGKSTAVPNYITESGFTEDVQARPKVGWAPNGSELFIYDLKKDTAISISLEGMEGISAKPDYEKENPKERSGKKKELRAVNFYGPLWADHGDKCIVAIRSIDNKDRWIMSLDVATRRLTLVDHQRDEAWIGGPGIGGFFGNLNIGWLSDDESIWFQSEESGYSHLYVANISTGKKTAMTSGKYEVQATQLSNDKKFFYLTTNEVHPGEKQFYRLPVTGGKTERISTMSGANDVLLSPDEKWLAIRYSYSNKPWELFLQENKPGGKPQPVTSSLSKEFKSYAWREPQVVTIKATDGADIYARVYQPEKPNGAAVIFVHGAGYLQNAHKWWSSYFHEYMFHNLLADQGYTVLDMDYRASAGYGRDWRTAIYRSMGDKDLTDNIAGAKWLVEKYHVDPKRMGIYGGSYGGFITLMAMFKTPDVFAAGAALRAVTDWAHYNHGYTSSILNEPFADSVAYVKSSPIYYAQGLKGSLLLCHGMVDVNVHFQDAVRLSQRLIELGKNNWELAVYPMEDHGFIEASSWTDEYKRILKLFDEKLK